MIADVQPTATPTITVTPLDALTLTPDSTLTLTPAPDVTPTPSPDIEVTEEVTPAEPTDEPTATATEQPTITVETPQPTATVETAQPTATDPPTLTPQPTLAPPEETEEVAIPEKVVQIERLSRRTLIEHTPAEEPVPEATEEVPPFASEDDPTGQEDDQPPFAIDADDTDESTDDVLPPFLDIQPEITPELDALEGEGDLQIQGEPLPMMLAASAPGAADETIIPSVRTITYAYDGLYRVIGADYCNGVSSSINCQGTSITRSYDYTYDLMGNRLTASEIVAGLPTTTTYTYNAANQIIAAQTGGDPLQNFVYDPAGNLIDDGLTTYSYDANDRLIGLDDGSFSHSYDYDGLGNRYRQSVDSVTTTYLLDSVSGLTQVLGEFSPGDDVYYLLGLDIIGQQHGAEWSYFGHDSLGSVRTLTDASGARTYQASYDPYGVPITQYGAGTTTLGFTGEQTDPTGLLYLRARYANLSTGTFLTKDPFEGYMHLVMSRNGYSYVHGNPVNLTDPSGEAVWAPLAITLIGAGVGVILDWVRQVHRNIVECGFDFWNAAFHENLNIEQLATGGYLGATAGLGIGVGKAAIVGSIASGLGYTGGVAVHNLISDKGFSLEGFSAFGFSSSLFLGGVLGVVGSAKLPPTGHVMDDVATAAFVNPMFQFQFGVSVTIVQSAVNNFIAPFSTDDAALASGLSGGLQIFEGMQFGLLPRPRQEMINVVISAIFGVATTATIEGLANPVDAENEDLSNARGWG